MLRKKPSQKVFEPTEITFEISRLLSSVLPGIELRLVDHPLGYRKLAYVTRNHVLEPFYDAWMMGEYS